MKENPLMTAEELARHIIWAAHANDNNEDRLVVSNLVSVPEWVANEIGRVGDFCKELKNELKLQLKQRKE